MSVTLLAPAEATIGEAPVGNRSRITWTDPVSGDLLVAEAGGWRRIASAAPLWSLAMAGDALVGTTDLGFAAVNGEIGGVRPGPAAPLAAGCRLNDMAVDPDGGLWAGTMHKGLLTGSGTLVRAATVGEKPRVVAEGLGVPNGMAFTADGRTLYLIDTLQRTLLAFPCGGDRLGEPVVVTDFMNIPGKPDGMTIASDGHLWVAMWGGGCVIEIAPDGAALRRVEVPAPQVSSACFIGPGRLAITSSRLRLGPEALAQWPGSGGLFVAELGDSI
jgi:sugar lactone lactonase YvrE